MANILNYFVLILLITYDIMELTPIINVYTHLA